MKIRLSPDLATRNDPHRVLAGTAAITAPAPLTDAVLRFVESVTPS